MNRMRLGIKRAFSGNSIYQGGIVDSKSQSKEKRCHQVMTLFVNQTELIPNADSLPTATLKETANLSVYNTSNLSTEFSADIQLIWSLSSVLYEADKSNDNSALQKWLRNLVQPGIESQLERQSKIYQDDPFISAFIYLTFGQRELASEQAEKNQDYGLAMFIVHSELKDMTLDIKEQLFSLQKLSQWNDMSTFHKKCWYLIAGHFDYVYEEGFNVSDGIYWQCLLGMYIWYGTGRDQAYNLKKYNHALDRSNSTLDIKAKRNIAKPDTRCLWYQLLQWWIGDESIAVIDDWPLDLVWLLSIYKIPSKMDERYAKQWIKDLETKDLAEWAIYAALFLKDSRFVEYILRQCEWTNEAKLVNEYHIPKKKIQIAKALNAHDSWDYELEYKHLIEGGLYMQAKLALYHFLLPKLFQNNENALQSSLKFLEDFPKDLQDEDIISLKQSYTYLLSEGIDSNVRDDCINKLMDLQEAQESRSFNETLQGIINLIKIKKPFLN